MKLIVVFMLLRSMSVASIIRSKTTHCNSFLHFIASARTIRTQCSKMKSLSEWSFAQPALLQQFKRDAITQNYVRRAPGVVFSPVKPTPLEADLQLVSVSDDCLTNILDLDPSSSNDERFNQFVAGNLLLPGSDPIAHRYGGHQFGYWADQLGDGRAILLGEYVNREGQRWELQLKGAGRTPYSRQGDGRAVLRSSIREFLCSEAMEALGVPTSRAAALVVSDDRVIRDRFYNGRPAYEKAAVVLRLAPSWFRIGSLEIFKRENEKDNLKQVVDFVMDNYYPEISKADYVGFFRTLVNQSTVLVAKWMAVGFAHGVLNTDNMSLLSITIDYGPFGFLDEYEPHFIPNHSDDEGRYSYQNQPAVALWNLSRLADALGPLVNDEGAAAIRQVLQDYADAYKSRYLSEFTRKLGLTEVLDGDDALIKLLLDMMEVRRGDFTQTFRQLGQIDVFQTKDFEPFWALNLLSGHRNFSRFFDMYRERLTRSQVDDVQRRSAMNAVNPQYVLRNWMAEAAIRQAESDDFDLTRVLLRVLRNPYQVDAEAEKIGFSKPPPSWSKSLRVSCSS